jgi:glycerol-3-phosphate acyltransferase PlsY
MSTTFWFIILVVCSYLLGSIPVSYLVAKWARGIDLRKYGSGNVGSANLHHTVSKKLSVPVAFYDLFKGMLMVFIAGWVGLSITQQVIVGLAAIAGHNWPVFLRFNGGRGILTALGVTFLIFKPWGIVVFLAIAVNYPWLKTTALPVLIAMALEPMASWLISWPVRQPVEITMGLLAIFIILIIRRLTAPKTPLSSPVTTRERLLNRLLFDRDIKDGKAWIYRKPSPASPDSGAEK